MRLYRGSNGKPVTLESTPLGAGGEARIFPVSGDLLKVAKVYHQPTDVHARKLAAMLADPPIDPTARYRHVSIAWPTDLLRESPGGKCVGFLMPHVSGMKPIFEYYNPRARRAHCPLFDPLYLHRTARNLAAVVAALHDRGYVIGDVNESNILVAETALVTLVDTDSFQVKDPGASTVYRCPVGKPDFTPPELQGVSFSQQDRGPEHDRFGLAVLLFQLLMEGTHPFDGKRKGAGESTLRHERIQSGHFPYGGRRSPYETSPASPPLEMLHPELQKLFLQCFARGHRSPKTRADAHTWHAALQEAEATLKTCKANPHHRYARHQRKCPWCARVVLLGGRDPFPASPAAVNVPVAPPKTKPHPAPATSAGKKTAPQTPKPSGPRLVSAKTTVRAISTAKIPSPSAAVQSVKNRVHRFTKLSLKRPSFPLPILPRPRLPRYDFPPQIAGVAALLQTPIQNTPTAWTGFTVLFAMLSCVPGLSFWAGLSAVGCGVLEYRHMKRLTLGSVFGVGVGIGVVAKVLTTFLLAVPSLMFFHATTALTSTPPSRASSQGMMPPLKLYSSTKSAQVGHKNSRSRSD